MTRPALSRFFYGQIPPLESFCVGILFAAAVDDDCLLYRRTHRPVGHAIMVKVGDGQVVEAAGIAVGADMLDQLDEEGFICGDAPILMVYITQSPSYIQ
jgi:hypothetical protein